MAQFGGKPLTFKRLLDILRNRPDYSVSLQAEAGVLGPSQVYYVEKRPEAGRKRTRPSNILYSFIEVYHDDVIVTPNRLRVICQELGLDEEDIREQAEGH